MPYQNRLSRFQERIEGAADLVMLPLSSDLEYLTGTNRSVPSFGAILHPGDWLEGLWMTPARDPVLALSRMTALFCGASMSGFDVRILGDHDDPFAFAGPIIEEFDLPPRPRVAVGDRAHGETLIAIQTLLPEARFLSATELLRPLRMIKSEEEIALMRRAGEITEAAHRDLLPKLKHGMTELDVIAELAFQLRRHGASGPSFPAMLYCSGPRHELIFGKPVQTQQRELHPPVAVLTDFGAVHEGYCYDYGRTIFFGEPDAEFLEAFETVMKSQAKGILALRAGERTAAESDAAARRVIEEAGFGEQFRHRLGHGIGLDVHEPPFLTAGDDTVLHEGMTFTVEPSIMFQDRCSVRVEDVVVVRPGGGEPLTAGFQTLHVV